MVKVIIWLVLPVSDEFENFTSIFCNNTLIEGWFNLKVRLSNKNESEILKWWEKSTTQKYVWWDQRTSIKECWLTSACYGRVAILDLNTWRVAPPTSWKYCILNVPVTFRMSCISRQIMLKSVHTTLQLRCGADILILPQVTAASPHVKWKWI